MQGSPSVRISRREPPRSMPVRAQEEGRAVGGSSVCPSRAVTDRCAATTLFSWESDPANYGGSRRLPAPNRFPGYKVGGDRISEFENEEAGWSTHTAYRCWTPSGSTARSTPARRTYVRAASSSSPRPRTWPPRVCCTPRCTIMTRQSGSPVSCGTTCWQTAPSTTTLLTWSCARCSAPWSSRSSASSRYPLAPAPSRGPPPPSPRHPPPPPRTTRRRLLSPPPRTTRRRCSRRWAPARRTAGPGWWAPLPKTVLKTVLKMDRRRARRQGGPSWTRTRRSTMSSLTGTRWW
mmetsp:Transcript_17764/g.44750  ORF Transcript_17764/g.44750 Transcript_17764/m.44750 type:complete len:291 (+) Transcript_17764:52-924(+)